MTEYEKIEIRKILTDLLITNYDSISIKEGSEKVTNAQEELNQIFQSVQVTNVLDELIAKIEKERVSYWRDKINAIGYVKSIINDQ